MLLRPRQGLFVGVALLAAASVVLAIALARTWGPLFGAHVARVAPLLALGGAAAGGALLAAFPGVVRRHALLARAAHLSGLAGAATLVALLVTVHVRLTEAIDRSAALSVLAVVVTGGLPFLLAGIVVAAALKHAPVLAGRVVFAAFGGAALGAPLALGALRAGAPRAGLCVVGGYALASLVFYLGARGLREGYAKPRGSLVATFVLAAAVLFAGDLGAPWLKLPSLRFASLDKVETMQWSGLGLTTVDKAQGGVSWIRTDGTAGLPIYDTKTNIPIAADEMAYALQHAEGPVAVVGGGGGREVRTALKYGQKDIHAIEVDPILVRSLMLGQYKKASGDVYEGAAVRVVLEDARGYLRRSRVAFRIVDLVMADTAAAQARGALAAEPTELYTVEAFGDFLGALAPEGTLVATRPDAEAERLLSLAATALRRAGVAEPAHSLFACSGSKATTLLVRKTPLAPADIAQLRSFCRKNKLSEVFAPDAPGARAGAIHHPLPSAPHGLAGPAIDPEAAAALAPPVDDRPFFASLVAPRLALTTITHRATAVNAQALVVLAALLVLAVLVVLFALGLPLVGPRPLPKPRARPLLFFLGTGASLALAVTALFGRLGVLLGHPIYAFTTSMPALFVMVAIGGLVVGRVPASGAEGPTGRRAELLVAVLAAAAVAVDPLVEGALGLPFAARVGAALLLLAPVGLLAGSLLALGVRQLGATTPELLPWCFGVAGAGAFAGAAAAPALAMTLGYTAALLGAGAAALLAALAVPRRARPELELYDAGPGPSSF